MSEGKEYRCRSIPLQTHKVILQKNVIALVEKCDHSAALTLVESAKDLFSKRFFDMFLSVQYRSSIKLNESIEQLKKSENNTEDFFEVQDTVLINSYEYIQKLELLLKRKDYNNFSRAVSPGKEPENWYWLDNKIGIYKLSRKLLSQLEPKALAALDGKFKNLFKDCPADASNFLNIMQAVDSECKNPNKKLIEEFYVLISFENKIRNLAVYEIIGFSDSDIKQKTGLSSHQVLSILKNIFSLCCKNENLKWNGYEKLNEEIIKNFCDSKNLIR